MAPTETKSEFPEQDKSFKNQNSKCQKNCRNLGRQHARCFDIGFHRFKKCDTVSSFANREKQKEFELLAEKQKVSISFCWLSFHLAIIRRNFPNYRKFYLPGLQQKYQNWKNKLAEVFNVSIEKWIRFWTTSTL